jgi:hypothetical protein
MRPALGQHRTANGGRSTRTKRCSLTGLCLPECPCPPCTEQKLRDSGKGHLLEQTISSRVGFARP